jgi:D-serine deaminase-like pyridoxal phosphate-dependent protein
MNVDLSGGEKKRNETLQLAVLRPKFAVLDELDSGLDVDALRRVARRIDDARRETVPPLGVVAITHYRRLLTELRPGVYAFHDAQQLRLGTCTPAQVALVVLATVVSAPAPGRLVLDAGSKALGADRPDWMVGHGLLPGLPGAVATALSEHHAVVSLDPAAGAATPSVGSRVAVVPNHVCTAVNLADELVVVAGGAAVDRWPLAGRAANR